MIVSHRYKFIFLHSLKTGGSAVTLSLLRYLDRDDLWLTAPLPEIMYDALRSGFVPPPATHPSILAKFEERCGAHVVRKALEAPALLNRNERKEFAEVCMAQQPPHPPQMWQHVWAKDAREYVGPDVWDSYLRFSFERNPWDRMVSFYWWRHRMTGPAVSFRDFVAAVHSGDRSRIRAHRAGRYSNWPIYTISDVLAVDHLGRYETLSDELTFIMDKVGVPFDGWLPRAKHGIRQSGVDELYDEETLQMVEEIFHREIALLGYERPQR